METTNELISSLKFLGNIKKGDKINIKYMFIQPDTIITTISRSFMYPDNRHNALSFISKTIEKSFNILSEYSSSDEEYKKSIKNNIIVDLKNIKTGLKNLKFAYITDSKFCCDIETIIQEVDAKLINYII